MSDSDECLVRQAFDVDLPANFDPSQIPSDGQSYLQKVMYEAKQCPNIVVADVSKFRLARNVRSLIQDNSECQRIPAMMMLTLEDQLEEVAEFSNVRQKIARQCVRKPKRRPRHEFPQDMKSWLKFCFSDGLEATEDMLHESVLPFFSVLTSLSQCEILELLEYHVDYLESQFALTHLQAVWLYSLLVFTETPLLPDTCSTLRTLARTCSSIRATLDSPHNMQLPALNLFICLVARYFSQTDLGDELLS